MLILRRQVVVYGTPTSCGPISSGSGRALKPIIRCRFHINRCFSLADSSRLVTRAARSPAGLEIIMLFSKGP